MSKLYLMVGVAGCEKSTWVKNHLSDNAVHISRDEIRFNLLEPNDEYFKHEDLVFKRFVDEINWSLRAGLDVFADATHISKGGRQKLLSRVEKSHNEIAAIYIKVPLEQALEQNSYREGRALVPEDVIRSMYKNLQPPTLGEGFDEIYTIENNQPIKIVKNGGD